MAIYLSQKELIKAIESNIEAIESGEMNVEQLTAHMELVRDLYERTLILKYKAFETISTVEQVTIQQEIAPEEAIKIVVESETISPELHHETTQEETVEELVEEESSELSFDLFAIAPEQKEETLFSFQPISAPTIEETSAEIEEPAQIIEEVIEPVVEAIQQIEVIETPTYPTSAQEIEEKVENEIEKSIDEETNEAPYFTESAAQIEEPKQEQIIEDTPINTGIFYKKVFQVYANAKNQYGFYSLPTLSGSFGLNERLMYINELFDGSSESFSESIKYLDSRKDLNDASSYIQELAINNNWDIESDTVEEFIHKVCRRFA